MDFFIQVVLTVLAVLCASYLFTSYWRNNRSKTDKKLVPRADGALPLIGHLHQFRKTDLLHKKLASMAEKYGPAFTIKLGSTENLIISNVELAKECFTTLDKVFCNRPKITATKLLGYNYAMFGLAPYSSFWREVRRIATLELLSHRRIDMLKHVRASEVENFLKEMYDKWTVEGRPKTGVVVEMKQLLGEMTLSTSVKMVGGEGINRKSHDKLIRDYMYYLGVFVVSDAIPALGWIDHLLGHEKKMKRTAKKLDDLIEGWLNEHKERRKISGVERTDQDFMDVMLTALKDFKSDDYDADTVNKATCLNVVLGASDTSMVTLTWAISLLVNNPDKLKKAREEVDKYIPKDRRVEETDLKNLEYLHSIVKETLRLYPPAPLIALRSANEDCTLSTGHFVPKDTRLMVNAWKIHHDPSVWPEPNEFKPERFLTTHKDIDVLGHNHELIPFGSGRRSCPGIALGLRTLHFTLASLLHCYDFARPSEKEIDMSESLGLINLKSTPLEVRVTPRLDAEVYGF